MLSYQQYEEAVYNWLYKKHKQDLQFTFSLRQKAKNGAEKDYFIGTEQSNYFAFTLWHIPVSYPGSSGDLISIVFKVRGSGVKSQIEITHTNSPEEGQNQYALELINTIKEKVKKSNLNIARESKPSQNNFRVNILPGKPVYQELDEMLEDLDSFFNKFIPIVNEAIEEVKRKHPDFEAHRITPEEFDEMHESLKGRQEKYSAEESEKVSINYKEQFEQWLKKHYSASSNMIGSYLKAINLLNDVLDYNVYDISDLKELQVLYSDLIKKQSDPNEKYLNKEAPSYGENGFYSAAIKKYIDFHDKRKHNKMDSSIEANDLNQILYGPPGTGKTYKTKNEALKIIGVNTDSLERSQIKHEFDKYVEEGRIIFTTFHQSMSYEDFIEGIKPVIATEEEKEEEEEEKQVSYNIVNGIFKEACENAKVLKEFEETNENQYHVPSELFKDRKLFKVSLGNTLEDTGDLVYDFCKENNYIAIGWGGDIDFSGVKNRKEIQSHLVDSGMNVKPMDFNISAIERLAIWMRKGDIVFVSHGNKTLKAVGVITGDYEYKSSEDTPLTGYNHFRKVEWKILDAKIPVKKVYEKNFSQQSIYELYTKRVKTEFFEKSKKQVPDNNNYVIIIDEINRGNVSQIFGELITLIEEDKREGKDEALKVTLPYSKEEFSVPQNLHIIGTMNTADRSVEALDTALRRRFSFKEMMPKPELLKDKGENESGHVGGIDLVKLLTTINDRIEVLVDRDHTIGHSYFLKVKNDKDLKNVFKDKVIPLLQEYFFGDYSKMEMVIGSYFFEKDIPKVTFAVDHDFSMDDVKRYILKDLDHNDFNIIQALEELLGKKSKATTEA